MSHMRKGYRIVYKDECGDEQHIGQPYAKRSQAESAMRKARRRYSTDEGQRLWIESFDHAAPYLDETTGRVCYPDEEY